MCLDFRIGNGPAYIVKIGKMVKSYETRLRKQPEKEVQKLLLLRYRRYMFIFGRYTPRM